MALEHLLEVGEGIPAPEKVRRAANLQDVRAEHARSLADPNGFWGEQAKRFKWSQPWTRVLEWRVPDHQWFVGESSTSPRTPSTVMRTDRGGITAPSSASTRTAPSGAPPTVSCGISSLGWPAGCARSGWAWAIGSLSTC